MTSSMTMRLGSKTQFLEHTLKAHEAHKELFCSDLHAAICDQQSRLLPHLHQDYTKATPRPRTAKTRATQQNGGWRRGVAWRAPSTLSGKRQQGNGARIGCCRWPGQCSAHALPERQVVQDTPSGPSRIVAVLLPRVAKRVPRHDSPAVAQVGAQPEDDAAMGLVGGIWRDNTARSYLGRPPARGG